MLEPIVALGRTYQVEVDRRHIRGAYARVARGRVLITIPRRIGDGKAVEIAESLYGRVRKALESGRLGDKPPLDFHDGVRTKVLGTIYTVRRIASGRRGARAILGGSDAADRTITVEMPHGSQEPDRTCSDLVTRLISKDTEPRITATVEAINRVHFGSEVGSVRLRDNLSNWGSCSRQNNITLNFRLLYMPMEVMEYVMVHELAHTKVRGHGSRFWEHVGRVVPDYKERRRWLRLNGHRHIEVNNLLGRTTALPGETTNRISDSAALPA